MSAPARKVHFGHYLAYGSNDVLGAGVMFVMSAWTLYFFTTFCGLTASEAGLIFISARLLDAFFSPVIGYVSDRFHRTKLGARFGRRRFFILLAIPLLPSFALMWMDGHGFWYYLVTYVFFELVYAMEIIPYETLAAEMSPNYATKAKFAGARIICGQIANIDMTGELKNVSFGTPVFNDLDGYRKIPLTSMPYGQAMAILALGEFKRAFK